MGWQGGLGARLRRGRQAGLGMGVLGGEAQGVKRTRVRHKDSERPCPPKGQGKLLTLGIRLLVLCFREHSLTCWLGGSGQGQVRTSPWSWPPHPCSPPPSEFSDTLPPPQTAVSRPLSSSQPCSEDRRGVGSPEGLPPSPPSALSRHLDETGGKPKLQSSPVLQGGHFWNVHAPGTGWRQLLPCLPPHSVLRG